MQTLEEWYCVLYIDSNFMNLSYRVPLDLIQTTCNGKHLLESSELVCHCWYGKGEIFKSSDIIVCFYIALLSMLLFYVHGWRGIVEGTCYMFIFMLVILSSFLVLSCWHTCTHGCLQFSLLNLCFKQIQVTNTFVVEKKNDNLHLCITRKYKKPLRILL